MEIYKDEVEDEDEDEASIALCCAVTRHFGTVDAYLASSGCACTPGAMMFKQRFLKDVRLDIKVDHYAAVPPKTMPRIAGCTSNIIGIGSLNSPPQHFVTLPGTAQCMRKGGEKREERDKKKDGRETPPRSR